MIKTFVLENCGPIKKVHWDVSPHINLIIGPNGTGKSLLLKILYTLLRATEEFKRGNNDDTFRQIIGRKLRGTFQIDRVGDLVSKGENRLRLECQLNGQKIAFSFSPSAERGVGEVSELVKPRESLSIFLPPKEILSLTDVIIRSRTVDKIRGFDDTYLDLAFALQGQPQRGKTYSNLAKAREKLSDLFQGRLERVGTSWQFKEGNAKHPIHITAEGVKRLSLIDWLIGNRSLYPGSVLFIDEPEAMLHPQAIVEFMEILYLLSQQQIQIFMASHSYFVLKSLYVIAKRERLNIQVLSLAHGADYTTADLSQEMPINPIINEAIALYERELAVEL
jgi:energy-coupling factor transporter ATP-binding protein EcfA2